MARRAYTRIKCCRFRIVDGQSSVPRTSVSQSHRTTAKSAKNIRSHGRKDDKLKTIKRSPRRMGLIKYD